MISMCRAIFAGSGDATELLGREIARRQAAQIAHRQQQDQEYPESPAPVPGDMVQTHHAINVVMNRTRYTWRESSR